MVIWPKLLFRHAYQWISLYSIEKKVNFVIFDQHLNSLHESNILPFPTSLNDFASIVFLTFRTLHVLKYNISKCICSSRKMLLLNLNEVCRAMDESARPVIRGALIQDPPEALFIDWLSHNGLFAYEFHLVCIGRKKARWLSTWCCTELLIYSAH